MRDTETSPARLVARHSFVLAIISGVGLVTGLGREMAVAFRFGTNREYDAFLVASLPFELASFVVATQVPALVRAIGEADVAEGAAAGEALGRGVMVAWAAILAGVGVATAIAAPLLVGVLAPGMTEPARSRATTLMLAMAPALLFAGWSALQGAVLNARSHFAAVGLSGVWLNILVAAAVLVAGRALAGVSLVAGTVAGLALAIAVQATVSRRLRAKGPRPKGIPAAQVRRFFWNAWPLIAQALLSRGFWVVERNLASSLAEGSVAVLAFGSRFAVIPVALLSAVGAPLFASMAGHSVRGDQAGLARLAERGLRLTLLVAMPLVAFLAVFAGPVVRVFLARGSFGPDAVSRTSAALQAFTIGIVGWIGADLCTRMLWAQAAYLQSLAAAAIFVALELVSGVVLRNALGVTGVALARSVALTGYFLLALFLVARMTAGFSIARVAGSTLAQAAVAAVAVLVVRWIYDLYFATGGGGATPWLVLVLATAGGLSYVAYLALARAVGLRDAREVIAFAMEGARRRLTRRGQATLNP